MPTVTEPASHADTARAYMDACTAATQMAIDDQLGPIAREHAAGREAAATGAYLATGPDADAAMDAEAHAWLAAYDAAHPAPDQQPEAG